MYNKIIKADIAETPKPCDPYATNILVNPY